MQLMGQGFLLTASEAQQMNGFDTLVAAKHFRPFVNGRDLTANSRGLWAIDFFGLDQREAALLFPLAYQRLMDTVRPEREQNARDSYRTRWWQFGENVNVIRAATEGLIRYIATVYTGKHCIFSFINCHTLVDATINVMASDQAHFLSILSGRHHVCWALAAGARLGYGNDPRYSKSKCFDRFPFPIPTEAQTTRLRALGEELDAHRKAQQAAHPKLTLTGMYNVLEKRRAEEQIEGKDSEIYVQGLIGILRDIYDRIDTEVSDAYGWPADLPDAEILQRLVDLNHERTAEEAQGLVRWLRPDYQNPAGRGVAAEGETLVMDLGPTESTAKTPWPKTLLEQFAAVRTLLQEMGEATLRPNRPPLLTPAHNCRPAIVGKPSPFGAGQNRGGWPLYRLTAKVSSAT